ncbi:hypothetical protein [Clostridium fungisolvens]|nr:hypothetical protein [Clostridium fungisolvens]
MLQPNGMAVDEKMKHSGVFTKVLNVLKIGAADLLASILFL